MNLLRAFVPSWFKSGTSIASRANKLLIGRAAPSLEVGQVRVVGGDGVRRLDLARARVGEREEGHMAIHEGDVDSLVEIGGEVNPTSLLTQSLAGRRRDDHK